MVWVALDRAIKAVEQQWLQGPVEKWRDLRGKVYDEVMSRGYNQEKGSVTQHYDTTEVGASLLPLADGGVVPARRPRVTGRGRAGQRGAEAARPERSAH